jgi:cytochrome c-type biogenesis protein CcmE
MMRRGGQSRIGTVVASVFAASAVGMAILVLGGMKGGAIYSKPVDVLLSDPSRFAGRSVRVEGELVHGTLVKRDSPCEYRFSIMRNGLTLPVRYAGCVVPDTFRDVAGIDLAVTVDGELKRDGMFVASSVLAKCPSKYEMQQRKGRGESMPHAPLSMSTPLRDRVDLGP